MHEEVVWQRDLASGRGSGEIEDSTLRLPGRKRSKQVNGTGQAEECADPGFQPPFVAVVGTGRIGFKNGTELCGCLDGAILIQVNVRHAEHRNLPRSSAVAETLD